MAEPLIKTWNLPGFEAPINPEKVRGDEEFDKKGRNATPEWTRKMQENFMSTIYKKWKQTVEDVSFVNNNEWINEWIDKLEQLQNSPLLPILKALNKWWHISSKNFESLSTTLSESSKEEANSIVTYVVKIKVNDRKLKESLISHLTWSEAVTEDNFKDTEFAKHKDVLWIDDEIWGLEFILAENYISIPSISWKESIEENLSTTLEVVLNKVLEKHTDDFRLQNSDTIWKIRNESTLEWKYNKLKDLYKKGLRKDARALWIKSKADILRKKESLIERAEQVTDQLSIAEKKVNIEALIKLKKEKQQIIVEAQKTDEIEVWDIFKWWENDIIWEAWDINQKDLLANV